VKQENQSLREENQRLRDEIHRLTGEQAKLTIKANMPNAPLADHSSERERRQPRARRKRGPRKPIPIDRQQVLAALPGAAAGEHALLGQHGVRHLHLGVGWSSTVNSSWTVCR
jgi:hypothetical protein